jgi:hypothetical protein
MRKKVTAPVAPVAPAEVRVEMYSHTPSDECLVTVKLIIATYAFFGSEALFHKKQAPHEKI